MKQFVEKYNVYSLMKLFFKMQTKCNVIFHDLLLPFINFVCSFFSNNESGRRDCLLCQVFAQLTS